MTAAMATNLNRHGAAIQLPRQLAVGSTLIVRNANGAQVFAKVVGQLAVSQALCSYGIEFIETSGAAMTFWGISFPKPEDRAAMAKATEDAGIARRGAEND